MTRRSGIWLVVAVVFTAINLAGAVMAIRGHEAPHAAAHVLLALAGAYVVWRRWPPGRERAAVTSASSSEIGRRLGSIEQAVDAMAIEVERIGEGQRFMTRLFTDEGAPSATPERAEGQTSAKARPPDDPSVGG